VIIASVEEWNCKTSRKDTLAEFLLSSPLAGTEVDDEGA
jgi:hypothetical protein